MCPPRAVFTHLPAGPWRSSHAEVYLLRLAPYFLFDLSGQLLPLRALASIVMFSPAAIAESSLGHWAAQVRIIDMPLKSLQEFKANLPHHASPIPNL